MKRLFVLLLAVVLLFSFAACNNDNQNENENDKQSVSDYMGDWKANALKSRFDNEITYQVATITLQEDGTCIYKGESAKWEYVAGLHQFIFTLDRNGVSGALEIAEENGKTVLKYFSEIYYRPADFVAKDKEYVGSTALPADDTATPVHHPSPSIEQSKPKQIAITLDNWDEYFEVYEYVDWQLNAFGEPTEFFGIQCCFNIKQEYAGKCSAAVAVEYLINQSHCDVAYDVKNQTYTLINKNDYFNEHTATLLGDEYERYISFSLGDAGKTTGRCTITKYNFIKMTRVQGNITFYE